MFLFFGELVGLFVGFVVFVLFVEFCECCWKKLFISIFKFIVRLKSVGIKMSVKRVEMMSFLRMMFFSL